jgi:hypothetical protein
MLFDEYFPVQPGKQGSMIIRSPQYKKIMLDDNFTQPLKRMSNDYYTIQPEQVG